MRLYDMAKTARSKNAGPFTLTIDLMFDEPEQHNFDYGQLLGERYGERVLDAFARVPGFRAAFERLRHHDRDSASLALEAGCSERTAELIRHQADPVDPEAGLALQLADEAC